MAISEEEVRYIATLARLRFDDDEQRQLAHEMSDILRYMEKLNELDTSAVPPMSHVLDLVNVVRKDECAPRISHEEALQNAPDTDGSYFRVPRVIE